MRPLLVVAALTAAAWADGKLDDAEAEMAKADEYAAKKDYTAAIAASAATKTSGRINR